MCYFVVRNVRRLLCLDLDLKNKQNSSEMLEAHLELSTQRDN